MMREALIDQELATYVAARRRAHQRVHELLPVGTLLRVKLGSGDLTVRVSGHQPEWLDPAEIHVENPEARGGRTVLNLTGLPFAVVSIPEAASAEVAHG